MFAIELRLRRLDGTVLHAAMSTSPLFDESGFYDGSLGIVRDLAERMEQKKDLSAEDEKALHAALIAAAPKIFAAKASKEYQQAFETISTLRPQVDAFFDTVMVMAEEEDLRRNRLALLTKLKNEVSAIAHLEEMGGEDAR